MYRSEASIPSSRTLERGITEQSPMRSDYLAVGRTRGSRSGTRISSTSGDQDSRLPDERAILRQRPESRTYRKISREIGSRVAVVDNLANNTQSALWDSTHEDRKRRLTFSDETTGRHLKTLNQKLQEPFSRNHPRGEGISISTSSQKYKTDHPVSSFGKKIQQGVTSRAQEEKICEVKPGLGQCSSMNTKEDTNMVFFIDGNAAGAFIPEDNDDDLVTGDYSKRHYYIEKSKNVLDFSNNEKRKPVFPDRCSGHFQIRPELDKSAPRGSPERDHETYASYIGDHCRKNRRGRISTKASDTIQESRADTDISLKMKEGQSQRLTSGKKARQIAIPFEDCDWSQRSEILPRPRLDNNTLDSGHRFNSSKYTSSKPGLMYVSRRNSRENVAKVEAVPADGLRRPRRTVSEHSAETSTDGSQLALNTRSTSTKRRDGKKRRGSHSKDNLSNTRNGVDVVTRTKYGAKYKDKHRVSCRSDDRTQSPKGIGNDLKSITAQSSYESHGRPCILDTPTVPTKEDGVLRTPWTCTKWSSDRAEEPKVSNWTYEIYTGEDPAASTENHVVADNQGMMEDCTREETNLINQEVVPHNSRFGENSSCLNIPGHPGNVSANQWTDWNADDTSDSVSKLSTCLVANGQASQMYHDMFTKFSDANKVASFNPDLLLGGALRHSEGATYKLEKCGYKCSPAVAHDASVRSEKRPCSARKDSRDDLHRDCQGSKAESRQWAEQKNSTFDVKSNDRSTIAEPTTQGHCGFTTCERELSSDASSASHHSCVSEVLKTVHSIKEEIHSVFDRLTSLEIHQDRRVMQTALSIRKGVFEMLEQARKTEDTGPAVKEVVKTALQALCSLGTTVAAELAEESDYNNMPYELYKIGKDEYNALIEAQGSDYNISVLPIDAPRHPSSRSPRSSCREKQGADCEYNDRNQTNLHSTLPEPTVDRDTGSTVCNDQDSRGIGEKSSATVRSRNNSKVDYFLADTATNNLDRITVAENDKLVSQPILKQNLKTAQVQIEKYIDGKKIEVIEIPNTLISDEELFAITKKDRKKKARGATMRTEVADSQEYPVTLIAVTGQTKSTKKRKPRIAMVERSDSLSSQSMEETSPVVEIMAQCRSPKEKTLEGRLLLPIETQLDQVDSDQSLNEDIVPALKENDHFYDPAQDGREDTDHEQASHPMIKKSTKCRRRSRKYPITTSDVKIVYKIKSKTSLTQAEAEAAILNAMNLRDGGQNVISLPKLINIPNTLSLGQLQRSPEQESKTNGGAAVYQQRSAATDSHLVDDSSVVLGGYVKPKPQDAVCRSKNNELISSEHIAQADCNTTNIKTCNASRISTELVVESTEAPEPAPLIALSASHKALPSNEGALSQDHQIRDDLLNTATALIGVSENTSHKAMREASILPRSQQLATSEKMCVDERDRLLSILTREKLSPDSNEEYHLELQSNKEKESLSNDEKIIEIKKMLDGISASQLNVSINKLHEEITKLRYHLETTDESKTQRSSDRGKSYSKSSVCASASGSQCSDETALTTEEILANEAARKLYYDVAIKTNPVPQDKTQEKAAPSELTPCHQQGCGRHCCVYWKYGMTPTEAPPAYFPEDHNLLVSEPAAYEEKKVNPAKVAKYFEKKYPMFARPTDEPCEEFTDIDKFWADLRTQMVAPDECEDTDAQNDDAECFDISDADQVVPFESDDRMLVLKSDIPQQSVENDKILFTEHIIYTSNPFPSVDMSVHAKGPETSVHSYQMEKLLTPCSNQKQMGDSCRSQDWFSHDIPMEPSEPDLWTHTFMHHRNTAPGSAEVPDNTAAMKLDEAELSPASFNIKVPSPTSSCSTWRSPRKTHANPGYNDLYFSPYPERKQTREELCSESSTFCSENQNSAPTSDPISADTSLRESITTDCVSLRDEPVTMWLDSQESSEKKEEDYVPQSSIPGIVKRVRDIFFGSAKAEAKDNTNEGSKGHACPATSGLETYKRSPTFDGRQLNSRDMQPETDNMEAFSEGYVTARRKNPSPVSKVKDVETEDMSCPKQHCYIVPKRDSVSKPRARNSCAAGQLSPFLLSNEGYIDESPHYNAGLWMGSKTSTYLRERDLLLTSHTSPNSFDMKDTASGFSACAPAVEETEKNRSHYSDAITGKGLASRVASRVSLSSMSPCSDSWRDHSLNSWDSFHRGSDSRLDERRQGSRGRSPQLVDRYVEKNQLDCQRATFCDTDNLLGEHRLPEVCPGRLYSSELGPSPAPVDNSLSQQSHSYVEHCGFRSKKTGHGSESWQFNHDVFKLDTRIQGKSFSSDNNYSGNVYRQEAIPSLHELIGPVDESYAEKDRYETLNLDFSKHLDFLGSSHPYLNVPSRDSSTSKENPNNCSVHPLQTGVVKSPGAISPVDLSTGDHGAQQPRPINLIGTREATLVAGSLTGSGASGPEVPAADITVD